MEVAQSHLSTSRAFKRLWRKCSLIQKRRFTSQPMLPLNQAFPKQSNRTVISFTLDVMVMWSNKISAYSGARVLLNPINLYLKTRLEAARSWRLQSWSRYWRRKKSSCCSLMPTSQTTQQRSIKVWNNVVWHTWYASADSITSLKSLLIFSRIAFTKNC